MLVIERQPGEVIRIGSNVRIIVVECDGGKVRMGIDAPDDVVIRRLEQDDPAEAASIREQHRRHARKRKQDEAERRALRTLDQVGRERGRE